MAENVSIQITASGPLAEPGSLPLAETARLLGEFQQTLERIALRLLGMKSTAGRRPLDVTEAVKLDFRGISKGSVVMSIGEAGQALSNETLDQTLSVLGQGAAAITNGGAGLPEEFDMSVLSGLLRFSGGIGPGRLNSISVTVNTQEVLSIDAKFRQITRELTKQRTTRDATLVGLLQMTDFAPSALKCRIDTLTESVVCDFDESFTEQVLDLINSLVIVRGTGQFSTAGDRLLTLDLTAVEALDSAYVSDVTTLAAEQGVGVWEDGESLAGGTLLGDDEFESFLDSALSARGDKEVA